MYEGVVSADGSVHVFMAHMGLKADLPMLQKMGHFKRRWSHVLRQASSRNPC